MTKIYRAVQYNTENTVIIKSSYFSQEDDARKWKELDAAHRLVWVENMFDDMSEFEVQENSERRAAAIAKLTKEDRELLGVTE
jgi:hypothetical protein